MPIAAPIVSSGGKCFRPGLRTRSLDGEPKRPEIICGQFRAALGRWAVGAGNARGVHVPFGVDGGPATAPSRETSRRIEIDDEGVGAGGQLTRGRRN